MCCYVRLLLLLPACCCPYLDKPCIVAYIMSHFMLLHSPYIAYLCNTPSPETMAGATASVKGKGGLLQLCVSRLRGFVWFFPLRRGEE